MDSREQELLQLLQAAQTLLADCQAELRNLRLQHEAVLQDRKRLQQENTLLRSKVDLLVRRVFGSSSEAISQAQLELALQLRDSMVVVGSDTPDVADGIPVPDLRPTAHAKRAARRVRLPDNLPVVEEVVEPSGVAEEPQAWRRIGQEVSEQLDFEPGRFFRRRVVRPKYVRKADRDAVPVIAPLPARLLEKSIPAPGLLAHVIVSKYTDHLPLYRQEQIFRTRYGVEIPRQTLSRWVGLVSDWLRLIYHEIRTGVLADGYVQIDETPIEYLDPGRGRTGSGWLWACMRPGGDVFFQWQTSRGAKCLDTVLPKDFKGIVQTDGYAAYKAYASMHPSRLRLVGCWAHVRRKFVEALQSSKRQAAWMLRQIQGLYAIEARLREHKASPTLRAVARSSESRMILVRMEKAMAVMEKTALPQGGLGRAISYARSQWAGLLTYLEDGRISIDNNPVENSIRPSALGKKNWLFVGDSEAGERAAVLYTVLESCRRRGIDPYSYLKDILGQLPGLTTNDIPKVTPEAWAQSHQTLPKTAVA